MTTEQALTAAKRMTEATMMSMTVVPLTLGERMKMMGSSLD